MAPTKAAKDAAAANVARFKESIAYIEGLKKEQNAVIAGVKKSKD
jgi:hypothetical protein